MDKTKGEYWDKTWNVIKGCSKKSAGCENCFALAMAARFSKPGQWGHALVVPGQRRWKGVPVFDQRAWLRPLSWKKPACIFATLTGDPFHEAVPMSWLERMLAVVALTPHHTYLLLTKRAGIMRDFLLAERTIGRVAEAMQPLRTDNKARGPSPHVEPGAAWWPLPNLRLGVSVENQRVADLRRDPMRELAENGYRVFVSSEPRLEAIDWTGWEFVEQLITGGENGPKARPMHPTWPRADRDWCAANGISFLFKGWGAWSEFQEATARTDIPCHILGRKAAHRFDDGEEMLRLGRKTTGRLLDGQIHHDFPKA